MFNHVGLMVATLPMDAASSGVARAAWSASGFPSGVYLYRVHIGNESSTGRFVLAR